MKYYTYTRVHLFFLTCQAIIFFKLQNQLNYVIYYVIINLPFFINCLFVFIICCFTVVAMFPNPNAFPTKDTEFALVGYTSDEKYRAFDISQALD